MYKTILKPTEAEIEIKKSRFIANSIPVKTEAEAKTYIETIKKEHHSARHHVYVYLLGEDSKRYKNERYSEDGEPHGTAAIPIIEMYKKEGISNICTVVTRYFGGIKLGTGGLVRAYTAATKAALADNLVIVGEYQHIFLTVDYQQHGKVEYSIKKSQSYLIDSQFSDKVVLELYIASDLATALITEIKTITADKVGIKKETVYGTIVNGKFQCQ